MAVTTPTTGAGTAIPRVATELVGSDHFQQIKFIDPRSGQSEPFGTNSIPFHSVGSQFITGSVNVVNTVSILGSINVGNVVNIVGSVTNVGTVNISNIVSIVGSVEIDEAGTFVHKNNDYTNPQTGAILWTPSSGNRIHLSNLHVLTGSGANAGLVTVWFAASGTTLFAVNTHTVVFRGEFAPSTTTRPGAIMSYPKYLVGSVNFNLAVTQTSTMPIYIQAGGYEKP